MLMNGGAVGGEVELLTKRGGVHKFHHTLEFVPLCLSMATSISEVSQGQLPPDVHHEVAHLMENLLAAEEEEEAGNDSDSVSEFDDDEREVTVEHDKATVQDFELDDLIVNAAVEEGGIEIKNAADVENESESVEAKVARIINMTADKYKEAPKRHSPTLLQKAVIIHEVDNHKGVNKTGKKIGVTGVAVSKMMKQRDDIIAALVTFGKLEKHWAVGNITLNCSKQRPIVPECHPPPTLIVYDMQPADSPWPSIFTPLSPSAYNHCASRTLGSLRAWQSPTA